MDEEKVVSAESLWAKTCGERSWSEEEQIIHLEGFIRQKGLFDELAQYASTVAREEREDKRAAVLEGVGYEFRADVDQHGMWIWTAPTDACEVSFASKSAAVESAWEDAVSQTKSIRQLTDLDWSHLPMQEQLALVEESLAGE
jgi:hypothetical protein